MKKRSIVSILALTGAIILAPLSLEARETHYISGHQGGYTGPGLQVSTVQAAKSMKDDQDVVLQGKIIQQVGEEKYLFQDSTGSINVKIEPENWYGIQVSANDTVKIYGEVDRDWNEVEIDVERVEKINR